MPSPRRSLLRIAYSPVGAKQTAWDTPLANGVITAVVNARTPNHIEPVERVEELFDCTGQYLTGEQVLSRYARLTLDLEVDINSLACFVALGSGVAAAPSGTGPYTHGITPLGPTVYALPVSTLIIGFADGVDPGIKWQNVAVNSWLVSGRDSERLNARIELIGSGNLIAASGYTFPDCSQYTPLKMTDGAATLDGENLLSGTDPNHTLRRFEWRHNNNILINDDPFPLAALDIKRLERADVRDWGLRLGIEGRLNDTLHTKAKSRLTVASSMRIGSATNGIIITTPSGLLKQDGTPQEFAGEANRGVLALAHRPLRIPGDATTPYTVSIVDSQASAYLG